MALPPVQGWSPRAEPKLFRLRIRDPQGKGSDVEASTAETVGQLKQRLEAAYGTPVTEQRLLCRGALMLETRSLGSYGLAEGAVVVSAPRLQLRNGSGINGGVGWGHNREPGKVQPWDAQRGFLMVPGGNDKWRPDNSGKVSALESDIFFDSTRLPFHWQIISHEFETSKAIADSSS
ncbi:unnamed protein product [Polarella glacialis]|uniref:Ubiquitin-like domain-containing protein n=1 Tax=Polarella glacialis TaxID=89957 RepID=A0A813I6X3_POLGL|nr:unnamed protein product [Polarella glacialis]CAE8646205.1 unnamed protein product [Polarella glacialis]